MVVLKILKQLKIAEAHHAYFLLNDTTPLGADAIAELLDDASRCNVRSGHGLQLRIDFEARIRSRDQRLTLEGDWESEVQ